MANHPVKNSLNFRHPSGGGECKVDNINTGLLIINSHGGIPIDEKIQDPSKYKIPVTRIHVGTTKLYYKSITLPGYYNFFLLGVKHKPSSYDSEQNDFIFWVKEDSNKKDKKPETD